MFKETVRQEYNIPYNNILFCPFSLFSKVHFLGLEKCIQMRLYIQDKGVTVVCKRVRFES